MGKGGFGKGWGGWGKGWGKGPLCPPGPGMLVAEAALVGAATTAAVASTARRRPPPPPASAEVIVVNGDDVTVVESHPSYYRKGKGKGKHYSATQVIVVDAERVSSSDNVATAPPPEGQVLEVKVPAGAIPGESLSVRAPGGQQLLVELPDGYREGSSFHAWFDPEAGTLTPLV